MIAQYIVEQSLREFPVQDKCATEFPLFQGGSECLTDVAKKRCKSIAIQFAVDRLYYVFSIVRVNNIMACRWNPRTSRVNRWRNPEVAKRKVLVEANDLLFFKSSSE